MKQHAFGLAALLAGIMALGLAVIPGIVLDRPLPFANQERQRPLPPEPAPEGGVTLKIKKLSITFGGGKKDDAEVLAKDDEPKAAVPAPADRQRSMDRDHLLKWSTIAAVACSLIGLTLGPISWAKEKQPAVSGAAMGICCLALVWQYIIIGIVAGAAIAVFLIVLSHLVSS